MSEGLSPTENNGDISKDRVISAYKKFVEKGITHPDDLDLQDPEVQEANSLFEQWEKNRSDDSRHNPDNQLRNEIEVTLFYVVAGFKDPNYVDEVGTWLIDLGLSDEEAKHLLSEYI